MTIADWKKVSMAITLIFLGTITFALLLGVGCHVLAWSVGLPVARLFP